MLNDWNRLEQPSKEEMEQRLKKARARLEQQQILMKEKKLPVLVLLEGWGAAGKSTTFKTILGLISPDSGVVTVFGHEPGKLTQQDRENMGVVLADSGFSGWLTVADILAIQVAMYHHFNQNSFKEKCEQFRIPLNKQIKEFSTGMRAKLKLLVALSHDAKLLILDEPTAGLDVVARDELLDMLRDYMETPDRGILISSHIAEDLEGLCDDIYMLEQGEVILHEDTDVLLHEYGILKVTEEQYAAMDKSYIVRQKKEAWGWQLLTDQKQYYQENARDLTIEKGGIDEVILMLTKGEQL